MTPVELLTAPTPLEDLTRREFMSSALAAALIAACGGDGDDGPAVAPQATTRTVDDYFGPVSIPVNPRRVIAAEASTQAAMINLGVTPVGGYFIDYAERPAYLGDALKQVQNVTATGSNAGIDIEKALALNPDLLITLIGTNGNASFKERYERYAQAMPTFGWMRDYNSMAGLEHNFVVVGRALGLEDRAKEIFAGVHKRVAELRQRVQKLPASPRINLVQVSASQVRTRIFEALPALANELGLKWAHEQQTQLSLEQIHLLNDADVLFFMVDVNSEETLSTLQSNPLWRGTRAVAANRVHKVDAAAWLAVDPKAIQIILDDLERFVIAPAERR